MAFTDPVFLGIVAAVVVFFFVLYLLIRRTVLGFREGFQRGKDR